jgi:hypothetical protein
MAAKKTTEVFPQDLINQYDKLIHTLPGIERKGATMPYTSLNGHMFSFIGKDGTIGLRLPKEEREEFIKKFKTGLYIAHNTILKEYVSIPLPLLKKTAVMKKYFAISFSYIKTLKPKPTKK